MPLSFFRRPTFAILDECTNATSVDIEDQLYREAGNMGVTVVTVSQRPALVRHHARELHLMDGKGEWLLRELHTNAPSTTPLFALGDVTSETGGPEEQPYEIDG